MAEQILTREILRKSSTKGMLMLQCLSAFLDFDQDIRRSGAERGNRIQNLEQQIAQISREAEKLIQQYRADAMRELERLLRQVQQDTSAGVAIEEEIQRKQDLLAQLRQQINQRLTLPTSTVDPQERFQLERTLRSYEQEVGNAVNALRERKAQLERGKQKKLKQQETIQNQLAASIHGAKSEQEAKIAEARRTTQPGSEVGAPGLQKLRERIPPVTMNSAVTVLEHYSIGARLQDREYLLQCVVGQVSGPVCGETARVLGPEYPQVVSGERVSLPYVLDRKCGVYQVFFHQSADEEAAWQHFSTLCLAQHLLHNRYHFELTFFDGADHPRELHLPGYGCSTIHTIEELTTFLDRVADECRGLQSACLREQYQTVWDYLQAHPRERQLTRCIALWNMPDGMTEQVIGQIERIYGLAERCGVYFLMGVNTSTKAPQALCDVLAHLTDQLNPLEYDPAIQAYRDLKAQSVSFRVEPLKELWMDSAP